MPPLAELQQQFAQALLKGEAPPTLLIGAVPAREALSVHRDTITGALVNALRLTYPTVDALVGELFFDQAARIFAEANPPRTASLTTYGEGVGDFLAGFAPAASLPYLADVARLDRAIETALRAPALQRCFALDAAVSIALPQSLAVLRLDYPADEIRAALGDDQAMAAIVPTRAERFILIWRNDFEAAVQRIGAPAGRFLAALLAGAGTEAAFGSAAAGTTESETIRAIQADIFAAAFCTVISNSEETSP